MNLTRIPLLEITLKKFKLYQIDTILELFFLKNSSQLTILLL